jgi:GT2 family glycosyltransferase
MSTPKLTREDATTFDIPNQKVAAIVVTYNGLQWIDRCLSSLAGSEYPVTTYVVDNSSTDKTVSLIKERFPEVLLEQSQQNLGFGGGNNRGIRVALDAGADFILLLNQDAWVEKDTIGRLVGVYRSQEDYGVLSPIHLNGEGDKLDWNFMNYISKPQNEGRDLYTHLLRSVPLRPVYDVGFVNAAAWLIGRECIEHVGVFDDLLFEHYGEDTNYVRRVRYHGYSIGVVPSAFIYHDREARSGGSTDGPLAVDTDLIEFKNRGANLLNRHAIESIDQEIARDRRRFVRQLARGRFSAAVHSWKVVREKRRLRPILSERRALHATGNS